MMKILDRYILAEFFRKWFLLVALIIVIMLLKDLLGELGELSAKKPPMISMVRLFLYRLPSPVVQMLPLSVTLGMMFSVGALAKKKEILAIHACGVSYLRLALPLAIVSILIAIGTFAAWETIIPVSIERARFIEKIEIPQKIDKSGKYDMTSLTRDSGVPAKGKDNRFYNLGTYDSALKEMTLIIITDLEKLPDGRPTVKRRIDAKKATALPDKENVWRFTEVVLREFDENGKLITLEEAPEKDFCDGRGPGKDFDNQHQGAGYAIQRIAPIRTGP